MSGDSLDPDRDPFRPPEVPVEVSCLHCGREYDSYLIEWRVETDAEGKQHGFWCCPTPGCGGMGFGFDILPTDPEYQDEHGGWVQDDEGEEDEDFDEEFSEDDIDAEDLSGAPPNDRLPDPGKSRNGNGDTEDEEPDDDGLPF
jgi:hypothetical protein